MEPTEKKEGVKAAVLEMVVGDCADGGEPVTCWGAEKEGEVLSCTEDP